MFVETPDGTIKVRVTKVGDGSFDWVSEDGNHAGTGFRGGLKNEAGKKIKPVAEKSLEERFRDLEEKLSGRT